MAAKRFLNQHILLVDDNPRLLRSMAFLMTVAGFQVTTAGSGAEALDALRESTPDFIIADAEMDGMDGYELVRAIRRQSRLTTTPVILTSANYELNDMLRALDLGADDFIPKPFDIFDLLDAIRRVRPSAVPQRRLAG